MANEEKIDVPPSLEWLREEPRGPEWLEALPSLVARCVRQWDLRLTDPFDGHVSYVAPGTTASGSGVVLKVNFPNPESATEAIALRHWDGNGAVRLLDEDDEARALLLERCSPGNALWGENEDQATEAVIDIFNRLWERTAPVGELESLEEATKGWSDHLEAAYRKAGRPFEADLLEEALSFMDTVRPPRADDVVLHQDLHGGNVLRRGSEWVVIDPKPLAGEREFDLTSYIRDRRSELATRADAQSIVRNRIDRLSEGLGLDRERVRGWALAHALAWGFDGFGTFYPEHILVGRLIARC